jgi:hypothetical protein
MKSLDELMNFKVSMGVVVVGIHDGIKLTECSGIPSGHCLWH